MTIDGDQPAWTSGSELAEPRYAYALAPKTRDIWAWVQIAGLGFLGAGVAVLVVFALTLGGR